MQSISHDVTDAKREVSALSRPTNAIAFPDDPIARRTSELATPASLNLLEGHAAMSVCDLDRVCLWWGNCRSVELTQTAALHLLANWAAFVDAWREYESRPVLRTKRAFDALESRLAHAESLAETRRVALGVCAELAEVLLSDESLSVAARGVALRVQQIASAARKSGAR